MGIVLDNYLWKHAGWKKRSVNLSVNVKICWRMWKLRKKQRYKGLRSYIIYVVIRTYKRLHLYGNTINESVDKFCFWISCTVTKQPR